MHNRVVILSCVLFALLVAGMFYFAHLKQQEMSVDVVDQSEPVVEEEYGDIMRIDAKHFYIDGTHTIVGEILMPTPCDLLQSDVAVRESYPEQVMIDFSVVNNADACMQVITPARFQVSAMASEAATFHAHFRGRDVVLNLIPAAEGETPDEFELYLKG